MAAQLRLVSHSGADPGHPAPPRVLCRDTFERLVRLNAAVRALREMGLHVLEQHVRGEFPTGGEPTVRIRRDPEQSIAPLLDAAGPRRWVRGQGECARATVFAPFHGVMVVWEEKP